MRYEFSEEQRNLLFEIAPEIDIDSDMSDDTLIILEEKVSDRLMYDGFDKAYEPTPAGRICESIIDVLTA